MCYKANCAKLRSVSNCCFKSLIRHVDFGLAGGNTGADFTTSGGSLGVSYIVSLAKILSIGFELSLFGTFPTARLAFDFSRKTAVFHALMLAVSSNFTAS